MYEKFVNNYSKKMWSIDSNKELSANFEWINKGTPIRDGDERLFGDQLTGYPYNIDGYNSFFTEILKDKEVHYSTKVVHIDRDKLELTYEKNGNTGKFDADIIINTGHTDEVLTSSTENYLIPKATDKGRLTLGMLVMIMSGCITVERNTLE